MNERERALLATFICAKEARKCLPKPDIFSSHDAKKIVAGLHKISKNGHVVDEFSISKETGIPLEKVREIIRGELLIRPDNIPGHIAEMKIAYLGEELFKEIKKQDSFLIKKGQVNVKKIVKILSEIKGIQRKKSAPVYETLEQFMKREFPERNTLIDPIFGEQEITMLHGPPKIGKSLLSLQIILHLATGKNLFDFTVAEFKKRILIMQSEISQSMMQLRCKKLFQRLPEKSKNKIIIPRLPKPYFFDLREGRDNLRALIEETQPGLVVVDPYGKFFSSEEQSLKDPRPFFDFWAEMVEKFGLSLFFVHHNAKFQEGKLGGQKALGSTAINASTDGNWNFERITDADLNTDEINKYARISFESRNWPDMRPIDLRLRDDLNFEKTVIQNKKIDEWGLLDLIKNEGGQVEFKKIREMFSTNLRALYRAKERGIKEGLFDEAKMTGIRGQPVYLTIKNGDGET
jgi:hypothetical protein